MRIVWNSEGGEYNNEHTFKHPWLPYMQARGKLRNETRRVTAKRIRRIRQENERRDRRVLESFVSVSAASDCPAELEILLWRRSSSALSLTWDLFNEPFTWLKQKMFCYLYKAKFCKFREIYINSTDFDDDSFRLFSIDFLWEV